MAEVKAKCVLVPGSDKAVSGVLNFVQKGDFVEISGTVENLKQGDHGFHIHKFGDTTEGCVSAGPHFNPFEKKHGGPADEERHVGDLGNIRTAEDLKPTKVDIKDKLISLTGPNSIIGRCLVVHAGADDLGKGGNEESKKTGNAGPRLACGIIGMVQ